METPGPMRKFQHCRRHVKKLRYNGGCAVRRSRASVCRCLSVCKKCCGEPYVCKCDKGAWANMTPLKQKYSCERSEWAFCTLMSKYKKKDCYNYMPSFTDGASDSDGDAKKVRTMGEPKHFISIERKQKLGTHVNKVTCS
jgi:hypothetical protein